MIITKDTLKMKAQFPSYINQHSFWIKSVLWFYICLNTLTVISDCTQSDFLLMQKRILLNSQHRIYHMLWFFNFTEVIIIKQICCMSLLISHHQNSHFVVLSACRLSHSNLATSAAALVTVNQLQMQWLD